MSELEIFKENKRLKEQLKEADSLLDICANNIHDEGEEGSLSDSISEYFKKHSEVK